MNQKNRSFILSMVLAGGLAACSSPNQLDNTVIENDVNENVLEVSQVNLNATSWTGTVPVSGTQAGNAALDVSVNPSNVAFVLTGRQGFFTINAAGSEALVFPSDANMQVVTTDNNNGYAAGSVATDILYQGNFLTDARVLKTNLIPISATPTIKGFAYNIGAPLDDGSTGIGVDTQGNIYIGGYTCGGQTFDGQRSNGLCDHFITKYNATGSKLWSRLLGSSGNEITGKLSVASNGSVIVTGSTTGSMPGFRNTGGTDVYVARFDTNGNRRWVKQFGTPQDDKGIDVSFDFAGGVYVTGTSLGAFNGLARYKNAGVSDGFVMRLNSSTGAAQWTKFTSAAYGFAGCVGKAGCKQSVTQVFDLAVDGDNNVYLTGFSPNNSTGATTVSPVGGNISVPSNDIAWPIKFDANGAIRGVTSNSPTLQYNNTGRAVAVAPGGVYLAYDQLFDGSGQSQPYLARFDFNLNLTK
jgi:hypothetical protein